MKRTKWARRVGMLFAAVLLLLFVISETTGTSSLAASSSTSSATNESLSQEQAETDFAIEQGTVTLTDEELEYVKQNPDVSIAIDTSWAPYGFEKKDGSSGGIIPNIIEMVAKRTGLHVDCVATDSYADAIAACNSGKTTLVSGIADDVQMAEKNEVLLTDPYIEIRYSAVSNHEITDLYTEGAAYRVALCKGTYARTAMEKKMPSYIFSEYHSNQECLDAVKSGDADLALVATYSGEYFSNWHEYRKLQTIQINDFNWDLCFGVNKDTDPQLIAILNKGIASITENDLNQAIYAGASEAESTGHRLSDLLYERPVIPASLAGFVVALLAVMIYLVLSQRKKAFAQAGEDYKKELEESANIVNAAMESAQMVVWDYDLKSGRLTQKQRCHDPHGFGHIVENVPESLIDRGFFHPSSVEAVRKVFAALPTATEPIQGDYKVKSQDGSDYMWDRMILTPVWEDGVVIKAIGTTANVTYRKEKENQYFKLIDEMTMQEGQNLVAKGRYNLSQNTSLYYSRETLAGLDLAENVPYDEARDAMLETTVNASDRTALRIMLDRDNLLRDFKEGKTEGSFQYKRKGSDQKSYWSLLKYSLFEEPNSEDVIFFLYTYDVSERVLEKMILTQLNNTEYEALCLIEVATRQYAIRIGQSLMDTSEENVSEENKAENAFAGEPPEGDYDSVVKKRIQTFVVPEQRQTIEKQFQIETICENLKSQKQFEVAYSTIGTDGQLHRKRSHFSYLDDTKATIFYYRVDISEQYNREQQQLLQTERALRQAQIASESKTEFFSRMSHDMRTPMNGILGMVALSEDEKDVTVLKQNLGKIKSSGNYLLGLINDTLDFQKIESGKLQLEPQTVFAKDLLNSITEMVQHAADEKGIHFQVQLNQIETDWYIQTDPLRMKQIFVNLLSNAIKFTPPGGTVGFTIALLEREGMISHERITVTDTGIGMSREFLQNGIFQPFSQEYNQETAHYAGTGLGLSIAKKLVELMGGSISVESELGAGTTFTVLIDFIRVDSGAVKAEKRADELRQSNTLELLNGTHILLAEDHSLNAEIAKKLLQKAGCEVIWVKDGQQCVDTMAQAAEHSFDVILMDIRMPVLDGIGAAKAIRQLPTKTGHTIPIIAMTANAYADDVKHCLEAGMNAHLAKPIDPMGMYEKIAQVLQMK